VKLKAAPGVAGIALMGVEYVNDSDGCIVVPDDLVGAARSGGYSIPVAPARGRTTPAIDPPAAE